MLILIILGALIVLRIVSYVLTVFGKGYALNDITEKYTFFVCLSFIAVLLTWGSVCITKDYKYEQLLHEKQTIEYRLENPELSGNELLYRDIVELNNEIRKHKTYAKSLWIGIFYNEKIASLDYVLVDSDK